MDTMMELDAANAYSIMSYMSVQVSTVMRTAVLFLTSHTVTSILNKLQDGDAVGTACKTPACWTWTMGSCS